jgi:hypothetical protein
MTPEKPVVRVLEIRAAENGWVVSAFERSMSTYGDDRVCPYFSMVAETPKRCTEIIGDLLKFQNWQTDVTFLPVRRAPKVMTGA